MVRRNGMSARARHAGAARAADRREAARLIRVVGQPASPREKIKTSMRRVAEALNWEVVRVEHIWWGEARRIDAWEMDALRASVRRRFREIASDL